MTEFEMCLKLNSIFLQFTSKHEWTKTIQKTLTCYHTYNTTTRYKKKNNKQTNKQKRRKKKAGCFLQFYYLLLFAECLDDEFHCL